MRCAVREHFLQIKSNMVALVRRSSSARWVFHPVCASLSWRNVLFAPLVGHGPHIISTTFDHDRHHPAKDVMRAPRAPLWAVPCRRVQMICDVCCVLAVRAWFCKRAFILSHDDNSTARHRHHFFAWLAGIARCAVCWRAVCVLGCLVERHGWTVRAVGSPTSYMLGSLVASAAVCAV